MAQGPFQLQLHDPGTSWYRNLGDLGKQDHADLPVYLSSLSRYLHPSIAMDLQAETAANIFYMADQGSSEWQGALCRELPERNPEIFSCMETRKAAIASLSWKIVGDHADDARRMLDEIPGDGEGLVSFPDFVQSAVFNSLLPGYSVHEICWNPGGGSIKGFLDLGPHLTTFRFFPGGSTMYAPLIIKEYGYIRQGERLEPEEQWIIHRAGGKTGDLSRGMYVRPLTWLHLVSIASLKGLARYQERFAQPWIWAQIALQDKVAWEAECQKLRSLMASTATDMGVVTSNSTTLQPMEVSGSGNQIYGQSISIINNLVNRLLLGHTSSGSSSDGTTRSVGKVHSEIRHDLLASDAIAVAKTVNRYILRPWSMFRYGPSAVPPVMEYDVTEKRDAETVASLLKDLKGAGLQPTDLAEISNIMGFQVERAPEPKPEPAMIGKQA